MQDTSDTFGLVGSTLADKYRIERVVARGGFGTVYFARHTELDVPVAVKVLRVPERFQGALRDEFINKFKLEARTLASLSHAATVRVLDFGARAFATGDAPWMALEWLDGDTLEADLAGRAAGRSPREAIDLLRPAFDALSCAHRAGIAHRDIKPANLMLVKARRGEASLKVLDFGIAKVMDEGEQPGSGQTATATEIPSFSLYYAAPEQLSRARSGPWTDVHALALVLVELLTARRAYGSLESAMGDAAIYTDILDRRRPTPARFGVDVGPWEAVLARALAFRPAERYANADDLLAALEGPLDAADARWRLGASLAPVTAPAVDHAPPPAHAAAPDSLSGASSTSVPPTRPRRLAPLAAASVCALVVTVAIANTPRVEAPRSVSAAARIAQVTRVTPTPIARVEARAPSPPAALAALPAPASHGVERAVGDGALRHPRRAIRREPDASVLSAAATPHPVVRPPIVIE